MKEKISASFVVGAITLVFFVVGFQVALFINKVAVEKISEKHTPIYYIAQVDSPEQVEAIQSEQQRASSGERGAMENEMRESKEVNETKGPSETKETRDGKEQTVAPSKGYEKVYEKAVAESFKFNPNTISVEDLQRLGFTEMQAQCIDNYRVKGGKFRRKSDFAKSYVVSEQMYERLEAYIDIPLVELNTADSVALIELPGIGSYFAKQIIEYREKLGGYSFKEQLMDIYRLDAEKFAGLEDLICVDINLARPFNLWEASEQELREHPYIGKFSAHGVVLYRENTPKEQWSVQALDKAGVLQEGMAAKLAKCRIGEQR